MDAGVYKICQLEKIESRRGSIFYVAKRRPLFVAIVFGHAYNKRESQMQRGMDMNETKFLISEAAKTVDVETHVLRYWEEELALPIARNEMGHRCYTKQDIQIFLSIKELKRKGFQLKSIKELIPVMRREAYSLHSELSAEEAPKPLPEDKKEEFFQILDKLLDQIKAMNHQEERYKRLDAAIRSHQQSRKLVAVTKEQGKKRKKIK